MADNAQTLTFKQKISQPGGHTLKVWMVDPDVVLEHLIVGAAKASYFGRVRAVGWVIVLRAARLLEPYGWGTSYGPLFR